MLGKKLGDIGLDEFGGQMGIIPSRFCATMPGHWEPGPEF
jgi:hypothetical protein